MNTESLINQECKFIGIDLHPLPACAPNYKILHHNCVYQNFVKLHKWKSMCHNNKNYESTPISSDALRATYCEPSVPLKSFPENFEYSTVSPGETGNGVLSPLPSRQPGPAAITCNQTERSFQKSPQHKLSCQN